MSKHLASHFSFFILLLLYFSFTFSTNVLSLNWAYTCIFPGLYPIIKVPYNKTIYMFPYNFWMLISFCVHLYVSRRSRKEGKVHRSAALETAAMTAGTRRGVSLSRRRNTLETTPLTGERHLSPDTHIHTNTHYQLCGCIQLGDFRLRMRS